MSRIVPGSLVAGLAIGLGLAGGAAQAQQAAPGQPYGFGYQAAAYDGLELVPPGVYGGPGYGYSGHGYYYDGPGEGPLLVSRETRRAAHGKRRR